MLISLFSFFMSIESLGNDGVPLYTVSCVSLSSGQIAKRVNLKVKQRQLLGLNYFHRYLENKVSEILIQKVFHSHKTIFLKVYSAGMSSLNKLDAVTKGIKRFSNPQALSSALAALGVLQPRAFGLLNHLVPLVLASNYYLVLPNMQISAHTSTLIKLSQNPGKWVIKFSDADTVQPQQCCCITEILPWSYNRLQAHMPVGR